MEKENKLLNYIKTNKEYIILSVIILIAFILRVYKISSPSLWHDELMTFYRLQGSFSDTLTTLLISPFPPLYYILMKFWTNIFGFSEFALRFPSAIFSTLTIPYLYLLTKKLFNKKTALISSFLLAIFPYAINYAQEAKMYSMVWFLSIASFYHFLNFIENPDRRNIILYTIFTTLMIYTLYFGFLILITQLTCFLLYQKRKPIKEMIIVLLSIILLYIPWIRIASQNISHKSGIEWVLKTNNYFSAIKEIFSDIFRTNTSLELTIYTILILSGIIALFLIKENKDKNNFWKKKSILLLTFLPLILMMLIDRFSTPILVTRYVGFIHLPLIILIALTINYTNKWNKYLPIIILAILTISTFTIHLMPYYEKQLKIEGEDWRSFFNETCNEINNKTLIINGISSPEKILHYYGACLPKVIIPALFITDIPSDKLTANYSYEKLIFLSRLAPQATLQLRDLKNNTKDRYYLNKTIQEGSLKANILKRIN
ncbi:MAG: glycosyltransferase family 39 protein [Nanoarchaeota archaeon]